MLINNKLPIGYIFKSIKYDILVTVIISLLIYKVTHIYKEVLPVIPFSIPAFIGTAISILLSFKLNQSYDRWWEARKIWGSIVNDSRSFVIQLQTLLSKKSDPIVKKMALRQIAWCYSLGQTLRGKDAIENMDLFLGAEEIEKIKKHNNKPLVLLQHHGLDLLHLKENEQIETFSQIQINDTLVRLTDAMGKAERIKNTVFPITYRLILHVIIYLFIVILSLSLTNTSIYFEIALLLSIASVFFLLDRTALHLQDPFSNRPTDVSVTSIARTIEINIKQLLEESSVPEPLLPTKFYLL